MQFIIYQNKRRDLIDALNGPLQIVKRAFKRNYVECYGKRKERRNKFMCTIEKQ